jgi:hypothetical protein
MGEDPWEFCQEWNAVGRCDMKTCRRYKHKCLHCLSKDHPSVDCEIDLINQLDEKEVNGRKAEEVKSRLNQRDDISKILKMRLFK